MGVGHLELRAQPARESQRREVERLTGLGCVLLLRLEERAHTTQLGARPGDFEGYSLARLLQLELGQTTLRFREVDVGARAEAVEDGPAQRQGERAVFEPASVLT